MPKMMEAMVKRLEKEDALGYTMAHHPWTKKTVLSFVRGEMSLVADRVEEILDGQGELEALRSLRGLVVELRGA